MPAVYPTIQSFEANSDVLIEKSPTLKQQGCRLAVIPLRHLAGFSMCCELYNVCAFITPRERIADNQSFDKCSVY